MKFLQLLKQIFLHHRLIQTLARRELKAKYAGSFLGWMWSYIQPLVMILVFWFVFSVGFRVKPTNDVPFVVWLTAGMTSWFVFSDIISNAVGSVVASGNLVKKTLFPAEILPVISILTALFSHGVFLSILLGLLVFQGMPFSFFFIQIFYYLFCLIFFALGVSWVVSALHVFVRDVGHIVGVILQVGFWATPIFWDASMMSEKVQFLLKLNPMFYIVQGYRESFIYFVPFWNSPYYTLYFWACTLVMLWFGGFVYMKLKPQFADVL